MHAPDKESVLDRLSNLIIARTWTVFLVVFGFVVLSAAVTAYIPKDLSFTGFLGKMEPEIVQFNREINAFGTYSMLLLLLEGPEDEIEDVIATLTERLPAESPAKSVLPPPDPGWLKERAAWLWPEPIFQAVVRDVEKGVALPATIASVKLADSFVDRFVSPTRNAVTLSVQLASSPLDMSVGGEHFNSIDDATRRIVDEMDVSVTANYTGLSAVGGQDQRSVVSRIVILIPFTVIGVLLLVYLIEPRVSRVAVAGIALAGSVLMGLAIVGLIQGRITLGSAFFGLLLLGLGIDFGIHLLVSLRDGRSHGMSPEESLRKAINTTAEPIVLGAMSSALAFGVLTLIPNSLTRDMGLTAFFGVILGMVLMLTLLPAGWLILERRHPHRDAPAKLTIPGLDTVVSFSIAWPRLVLTIGVVLAVVGACGIPRYKTETDLAKIFSNDVPALDVAVRVMEIFGTSTTTYIARVESLEQARDWKTELEKLPGIASVRSPSDIFPHDMTERSARLGAITSSVERSSDTNVQALVDRLHRAVELGPIEVDSLPAWLKAGLVSEEGDMALSIAVKEDTLDAAILDKEIKLIRTVAPTATGVPVIVRIATMSMVEYVPYMVPMVFLVVTIVLVTVFRALRPVMMALVPVVVATSITFGFYFWLDLHFSIMTIVVVPVILGLGVDDGIHIVERIRRYKSPTEEQLHEAVMSVGRPILLTTSTTCVSFAALLFTEHSGLESIAHFMLAGIPMCFLASITMLPAAEKVLMDRDAKKALGE